MHPALECVTNILVNFGDGRVVRTREYRLRRKARCSMCDQLIGRVAVHVDFPCKAVLVRFAEMDDLAQIMNGMGAPLDGLELLSTSFDSSVPSSCGRVVFRIRSRGIYPAVPLYAHRRRADVVTTTGRLELAIRLFFIGMLLLPEYAEAAAHPGGRRAMNVENGYTLDRQAHRRHRCQARSGQP